MRALLLLAIIGILTCCSGNLKHSKDLSALVIDLDQNPESEITRLSEFASGIEYIPLETTPESLIGRFVNKIVNAGDRFYLQSGEEIFCFSKTGKYLFRLNKSGRGPEEYNDITDFDVRDENDYMTILSAINHKMLIYAISDSGFVFRQSLPLREPVPYRINLVPGQLNALLSVPPWLGAEPSLSLLISISGDTIYFKPNLYKYDLVRRMNFRASNEMIVYESGREVCFKEEFSDTVFSTGADSTFRPHIIFNTLGKMTTPAIRSGSEMPDKNTIFIANIFETPGFVFYYYGKGKEKHRSVYDKANGKNYSLKISNDAKSLVEDDLSGGPDFNIEFMNNYCSCGKLFSLVESLTLKRYLESEKFKNAIFRNHGQKEMLENLSARMQESDNPLLVVVNP